MPNVNEKQAGGISTFFPAFLRDLVWKDYYAFLTIIPQRKEREKNPATSTAVDLFSDTESIIFARGAISRKKVKKQ